MAKPKTDSEQYKALEKAVKERAPGCLYIFYGEERYLLGHYLTSLRRILIPEGLEEFNHRKLDGKGLTASDIIGAVDMLPAFSERTLIEVSDYDIFKAPEADRKALAELFADMPEYACLVFVYDTLEYKPDKRLRDSKELLKNVSEVEFQTQEGEKITRWIARHIKECGKSISRADAEYLAFITGGSMTTLNTEIEKLCSYAKDELISREDIDVCVIPVSDAVTYKLTNALTKKDVAASFAILGDLLRMREAPHKIVYGISSSMRQLYYAKLCRENGRGSQYLMENFGVKYDFQARNLMQDATRFSLEKCRKSVGLCAEAALKMNSGSDPENALKELLSSLCI